MSAVDVTSREHHRYPESTVRIGIDLGGTKIEGIALGDHGETLLRHRIPAPRDSYDETLVAIGRLIVEIENRTGRTGSIGVGTPGAISPATGLLKNSNSTWLNGRALGDDLPRLLGRPVRLANDANCFALSEATDGAAAGAPVVFGVILGTGTGGGIVANGRVLVGPNAIAGEWGHNPMPAPHAGEWPGPRCYCGRTGCIELFLSGPGMSRDYADHGGGSLSAVDIAGRAAAGDPGAEACLGRYEDRLARALAGVINILDPDVIVLGGGMSNIDRLLTNVPAIWGHYIFSDAVATRLVRAMHGDSSGVRGAAWLWD
jgi:fructokinase